MRIPLAGAEHDDTRWGTLRCLEKDALPIDQPHPFFCGGLSETVIAATNTTCDMICIRHGHLTPVNTVLSVLQSPVLTRWQEYLVKWKAVHLHWFKDRPGLIDGTNAADLRPSFFPAFDEGKIEGAEEL